MCCFYDSHSFIIHLLTNIYSVLVVKINKIWTTLMKFILHLDRVKALYHMCSTMWLLLLIDMSIKLAFDLLQTTNALTHLICAPSQLYIKGCSIFKWSNWIHTSKRIKYLEVHKSSTPGSVQDIVPSEMHLKAFQYLGQEIWNRWKTPNSSHSFKFLWVCA